MKTYEKYKNSGVSWLGKIPEHWKSARLKGLLISPLQYGANATGIEFDENLPRYIRITDITSNNKLKETGKQSLDYTTASSYMLNDNDLLFARSGATVGKTFLYKSDFGKAAFAGYLIRARTNSRKIMPEFVYFVTLSNYYEQWKNRIFIQSTIQNISAEKYNNLVIPVPPFAEQEAIVKFLDYKVSRIEKLTLIRERQIVKLNELKKAVINKAVTKGDWKRVRLKNLVTCNDEILTEDTNGNYEFNYIDISSVTQSDGITNVQRMFFKNAPSRARRIVREDDVIISTVRTYLKAVAKIKISKIPQIVSTGFAVLRSKNINKDYLYYAILSDNFINAVEAKSIGVSYPAINASELMRLFIPVPPLSEQNEIAKYLDKKCTQIDKLITILEKQITEHNELKARLISDAVTGKIDVR